MTISKNRIKVFSEHNSEHKIAFQVAIKKDNIESKFEGSPL